MSEFHDAILKRAIAELGDAAVELRPHVEELVLASSEVLSKRLLGQNTMAEERHLKARAANIAAAGALRANEAVRESIADIIVGSASAIILAIGA